MTSIKDFIADLSNDDIDLFDKLDNLCGHGQISDTVYDLALQEYNFPIIEHYVKELLHKNMGNEKMVDDWISFIKEETKYLYDQELIYDIDDYTSGLYNCDDLYLYAIAEALELDLDELSYYE